MALYNDIIFVSYTLCYIDQINDLGTHARLVNRDGGSMIFQGFLAKLMSYFSKWTQSLHWHDKQHCQLEFATFSKKIMISIFLSNLHLENEYSFLVEK
jgi:hypothetical protein